MPKLKNPRHELLAQNVVASKFNATKAYLKTYPDSSYLAARAHAVRLVTNGTEIKERIEEIANRKGMTTEFEIDELIGKHRAMRPIVVGGKLIDYPDHPTQLEAIKTGLKLHGFLNSDHNSINIDARSVNISLDSADVSRLADVVSKLSALSANLNINAPSNSPA